VGIGLGAIFDIQRVIRIARNLPWNPAKIVKPKKLWRKIFDFFIVFFEDLIYCTVVAIVTVLFVFTANKGGVRIIALVCEFVGFILYHFTLGILLTKCARKIIIFERKCLRIIYKYVILPPCRLTARLFLWIWKQTYGKASNALKKQIAKRKHKRALARSEKIKQDLYAFALKGFRQ